MGVAVADLAGFLPGTGDAGDERHRRQELTGRIGAYPARAGPTIDGPPVM